MQSVDVTIIGAGIAGASLAAELADGLNVVLVEREDQPGYHATGRSAAIYTEAYGNETIRALTSAGRDFFSNPTAEFSEIPLWRKLGVMFIGREDQADNVKKHIATASKYAREIREVSAEEIQQMVPILKKDAGAIGAHDPDAMELDVAAIHSGFLRRMKRRGGKLVTNGEVTGLKRDSDSWTIDTTAGSWTTNIVVNAAGAWADIIAELAGAKPVEITPLRRTAITFSSEDAEGLDNWPMVVNIGEEFYFKAEAGKILGSPADETKSSPCDAQPEELDVAIAVDRIQTATNLGIREIDQKWAGLRTFAPDRSPIVGFDEDLPGFFWLAGQGGYGIQTSPAIARLASKLILDGDLPEDIKARGITEATLSPARFKQSQKTEYTRTH
ncbi:MAG TPA: FAD-binding oxidoreductase [Rhodospirillales bacterium]|nr:FAD-binding oxidoreductase [Rhodospirillales bacterium]